MSQIKYKKGNLVDAFINNEVNVLIHQANCFCTMNSGIAKEIKQKLPEMFQADCETIKGHPSKLGNYTKAIYKNGTEIKVGYNLYGQYRYGTGEQYTDYKAIRKGLKSIAWSLDLAKATGFNAKIGLPLIGCGLAGGDWNIVQQIIQEELVDKGFNVSVYTL